MTFRQIGKLGLLAAFLTAGCSQQLPTDVGKVTGKVTLDGQPLADAVVTFTPLASGGATAIGKTAADGSYSLTYSSGVSGAQIGENRVHISTLDAGNPDSDPPRAAVPEKVPLKYNTRTELKVEVKPGDNVLDFPLKPGPVVQPGPDPE
jgi:hypothetical protein